ncbi:MAG: response regulator transcription factor [Clostridia bacterium]|nr:response regulator transcription factor [Clostridia bacterium]
MVGTKLLVVDDDPNICDILKTHFEKEGCEVLTAGDGIEGLAAFKSGSPDLVLLDIMLPKMDGQQVLAEIRKESVKPVIMVTAKGEVFDKVLGLEMGADDFVVKPFDLKELSARVKAVLRRYQAHMHQDEGDVIKFENFEISQEKFELKLKGKKVDIPPKELQLLYCLASNPNRVFSREQLLEHVWDFAFLGDSRTVDVHIKRLREKLEGVSDKWALKTVWGIGYKFELYN